MLQSAVPVLLLVAVALTSSNVLPIISDSQLDTERGYESHQGDNIFTYNRLHSKKLDNIFFKLPDIQNKQRLIQLLQDYSDPDNNSPDYDDAFQKDDNGNGKGYQNYQWNNNPRELDRLDLYKTNKNSNEESSETEYPKSVFTKNAPPYESRQILSNELTPENQELRNNLLLNPLLVLKINLAYLVNDSMYNREMDTNTKPELSQSVTENDNDLMILERYPRKIIPEETQFANFKGPPMDQRKTVKKRIFSLWSRLQSLSHKGHELQHRRHIYTLYGLSDNSGSGRTHTAETRAFMRPPGSPLRWG